MASDTERRLAEHNKRQNKTTKAYLPWKLVFVEPYVTRKEARIREKYLNVE